MQLRDLGSGGSLARIGAAPAVRSLMKFPPKTLTEYLESLTVKEIRELSALVLKELRRKEGRAFGDMIKKRS